MFHFHNYVSLPYLCSASITIHPREGRLILPIIWAAFQPLQWTQGVLWGIVILSRSRACGAPETTAQSWNGAFVKLSSRNAKAFTVDACFIRRLARWTSKKTIHGHYYVSNVSARFRNDSVSWYIPLRCSHFRKTPFCSPFLSLLFPGNVACPWTPFKKSLLILFRSAKLAFSFASLWIVVSSSLTSFKTYNFKHS